jgi:hypothetical protein
MTYTMVSLMLIAAAALASYVPALRRRIDPLKRSGGVNLVIWN